MSVNILPTHSHSPFANSEYYPWVASCDYSLGVVSSISDLIPGSVRYG